MVRGDCDYILMLMYPGYPKFVRTDVAFCKQLQRIDSRRIRRQQRVVFVHYYAVVIAVAAAAEIDGATCMLCHYKRSASLSNAFLLLPPTLPPPSVSFPHVSRYHPTLWRCTLLLVLCHVGNFLTPDQRQVE